MKQFMTQQVIPVILQPPISNAYLPDESLAFRNKVDTHFKLHNQNPTNYTSPSRNEFEIIYEVDHTVNEHLKNKERLVSAGLINEMKKRMAAQFNKNSTCLSTNRTDIVDNRLNDNNKLLNRVTKRNLTLTNNTTSINPICQISSRMRENIPENIETFSKINSYIDMYKSYKTRTVQDNIIQNMNTVQSQHSILGEVNLTNNNILKYKNKYKILYTDNALENFLPDRKEVRQHVLSYMSNLRDSMRSAASKPNNEVEFEQQKEYATLYKNLRMSLDKYRIKEKDDAFFKKSIEEALYRNKERTKIQKFSFIKLNNKFKYNIPIDSTIKLNNINFSSSLDSLIAKRLVAPPSSINNVKYRWLEISPRIDMLKKRYEFPVNFEKFKTNSNMQSTDSKSMKARKYFPITRRPFSYNDKSSINFNIFDTQLLHYRPVDNKNIQSSINKAVSTLVIRSRLAKRDKFYIEYDRNRKKINDIVQQYKLYERPKTDILILKSTRDQPSLLSNSSKLKRTNDDMYFRSDEDVSQAKNRIAAFTLNPMHLVDALDKRPEYFHS